MLALPSFSALTFVERWPGRRQSVSRGKPICLDEALRRGVSIGRVAARRSVHRGALHTPLESVAQFISHPTGGYYRPAASVFPLDPGPFSSAPEALHESPLPSCLRAISSGVTWKGLGCTATAKADLSTFATQAPSLPKSWMRDIGGCGRTWPGRGRCSDVPGPHHGSLADFARSIRTGAAHPTCCATRRTTIGR